MDYFDRQMLNYYQVLNNAWKKQVKTAARQCITALSGISAHERPNKAHVRDIVAIAEAELGDDFAALVRAETKLYVKHTLALGLQDAQTQAGISIGMYGLREQRVETVITKQNMFWLGEHYGTDVADKFRTTLSQAVEQGYTKKMLAATLAENFKHLGQKSEAYWLGLAEHTGLKIRQFGRLEGYRKAGIQYYRLVVVLDNRTSDICRALHAENKVYPLQPALDVMDNLLELDTRGKSLTDAREYVKAVSPWIEKEQIVYNSNGNPVGISGAVAPSPPLHWRCRTGMDVA